MIPVNSQTTLETESIARKQVYYENKKDKKEKERVRKQIYYANHKEQKHQYYIDNKVKFSEIINCECGGKFQHKGRPKHTGTKMHINFRLKREAEEGITHINLKPTPEEE